MIDRNIILTLIRQIGGRIIATREDYIEVDIPTLNDTIVFEFDDDGILIKIY